MVVSISFTRCKLSVQAPPRSLKVKKTKKKRQTEPQEEVTVEGTPRTTVTEQSQEPEISGKSDDGEWSWISVTSINLHIYHL